VDIARQEGDEVMCGGRRASGKRLDDGFFYEPTILRGVKPGSRLALEEVFGPVLSVIRFNDLDEAIRINNEVKYGLSSSLYTADVRASFRAMTELDNGITLHQCADHWRRGAPAVRRRQADGQRPPRGRLGGLRVLFGDEGLLHRLLRPVPARADRHVRRRPHVSPCGTQD
jgi:hypothetical protein